MPKSQVRALEDQPTLVTSVPGLFFKIFFSTVWGDNGCR